LLLLTNKDGAAFGEKPVVEGAHGEDLGVTVMED
jgi:hypothetical protein